jgi:hypothetical protein
MSSHWQTCPVGQSESRVHWTAHAHAMMPGGHWSVGTQRVQPNKGSHAHT